MIKLTTALTVVSAVLLASCGQSSDASASQPSATAPESSMSGMAMATKSKMGKSTGVVKAIDHAAGTVTLDHQAMAEVGWPAMTMTFSAKPDVLKGVTAGEKVAFEAMVTGDKAEVTSISRQ